MPAGPSLFQVYNHKPGLEFVAPAASWGVEISETESYYDSKV